jgi:hypothetical protein
VLRLQGTGRDIADHSHDFPERVRGHPVQTNPFPNRILRGEIPVRHRLIDDRDERPVGRVVAVEIAACQQRILIVAKKPGVTAEYAAVCWLTTRPSPRTSGELGIGRPSMKNGMLSVCDSKGEMEVAATETTPGSV